MGAGRFPRALPWAEGCHPFRGEDENQCVRRWPNRLPLQLNSGQRLRLNTIASAAKPPRTTSHLRPAAKLLLFPQIHSARRVAVGYCLEVCHAARSDRDESRDDPGVRRRRPGRARDRAAGRPLPGLQVRTADRDGYAAVQIGFRDKPRKNATRAERGHVSNSLESKRRKKRQGQDIPKKADVEPQRVIREFKLDGDTAPKSGRS